MNVDETDAEVEKSEKVLAEIVAKVAVIGGKIYEILKKKLIENRSFHFNCCQDDGRCGRKAMLAFPVYRPDDNTSLPETVSDAELHPDGYHFRCKQHCMLLPKDSEAVVNLLTLREEILKEIEKADVSPIQIDIVEAKNE